MKKIGDEDVNEEEPDYQSPTSIANFLAPKSVGLETTSADEEGEVEDLRARLQEEYYGDEEDEEDDDDWTEFVAVPPDGGWGWMVVFASFMANLVVDGISYSFGVYLPKFQGYYNSSQGLAAMIGSLLTGCYLVAGPVVGGLVNKFGSRAIMIVGSLIGTGAFFVSVWAPTLTILLITYGIIGGMGILHYGLHSHRRVFAFSCVTVSGIGFGFIYLPAIVHVGYYFEKKRALATGIAVAGSGVGTFIFPPLSVALLNEYSWKGSLWILAGFILNCAVCGALLRPLKPKRSLEELNRKLAEEAENFKAQTQSQLSMSNGGSANSVSKLPPLAVSTQISNMSPGPTPRAQRNPRDYESMDLQKLARIRSALSESSQGGEEVPMELLSASPPHLEALREEEQDGGMSRNLPVPLSISPKLPTSRTSRERTYSSTATHEPNGSIRNAESSRAVLGRPMSRMSARSYVSSIQRLNSVQTVGVGAAMSAQNLGTVVDPEDFNRPLYRRDIFYSGSIRHLPEFTGSSLHVGAYLDSTISVPQAIGDLPDGEGRELSEEYCSWLPRPVRHVCFQMIDIRLLQEPVMVLLCLSNIFGMLGFYVPFVYLNNRAEVYGVESGQAAFLLSIIGITNTLGRVVFGWVADQGWVSALTINNCCLMSCGLLTLIVPFLTTYAAMAAYSAVFGFLISAYISLTSIILVDYLGLEQLTNSFGLLILSRGLSAMIGSPLAGAVYDATKSYNDSFFFGGGLITVAGLVSCSIPVVYKMQDYLQSSRSGTNHQRKIVNTGTESSLLHEDHKLQETTVAEGGGLV